MSDLQHASDEGIAWLEGALQRIQGVLTEQRPGAAVPPELLAAALQAVATVTAAAYLAERGRHAVVSSEMMSTDIDALHRYVEGHIAVPAVEIQRLRELGLLDLDGGPTALGRAALGGAQKRV